MTNTRTPQSPAQRQARQRERNRIKLEALIDLLCDVEYIAFTGKHTKELLVVALNRYYAEVKTAQGI